MLMTTFKSCLIAPCCEEVTGGTNAILSAFDKLQVASMGGRILFGSFLPGEMSDSRSRRTDRSILLHCNRSRQWQMLKIHREGKILVLIYILLFLFPSLPFCALLPAILLYWGKSLCLQSSRQGGAQQSLVLFQATLSPDKIFSRISTWSATMLNSWDIDQSTFQFQNKHWSKTLVNPLRWI